MSWISERPNWMINTTGAEQVKVTPREYAVVRQGLRLPGNYFSTGDKVLSVGEGLSDFARKLHENYDVNVISVDPIYALGLKLFHKDPMVVERILTEAYGTYVELMSADGWGVNYSERLPLPDPKRVIAGSVYKLGFPDNSFSKILSYRMFEHIDFALALPELLRLLKENGEIRMGGLRLHADLNKFTLSDQEIIMHNSMEGYSSPHPGLGSSLDTLVNKRGVSTYALITTSPGAKVGRAYPNVKIGTVLIIRNDNKIPLISDPSELDERSELNTLIKIGKKNVDGDYNISVVSQ